MVVAVRSPTTVSCNQIVQPPHHSNLAIIVNVLKCPLYLNKVKLNIECTTHTHTSIRSMQCVCLPCSPSGPSSSGTSDISASSFRRCTSAAKFSWFISSSRNVLSTAWWNSNKSSPVDLNGDEVGGLMCLG